MRVLWIGVLVVFAVAGSGGVAEAQEARPNPLADLMEYLTRDGGRWESANPKHVEGDGSAPRFGYAFETKLGGWVVHNRILGLFEDREAVYWETIYSWHPARKVGLVHQVGWGGAMATGEERRVDETSTETLLTFTMANGESWDFREITEVHGPDEFESISYRKRDGEWEEQNRLRWKRVRPAGTKGK